MVNFNRYFAKRSYNSLIIFFMLSLSFSSCYKPKKIKVACIGDSITYGYLLDNPDDAYPVDLQRILGEEYLVKNFGKPSATVLNDGDLPYIKEEEFKAARNFYPDIVVIMLGTNDMKSNNWQYINNFKKDYINLINEFKNLASQPRIIINYIPPISGIVEDVDESKYLKINELIESVANEKELDYFNPYFTLIKCENCYIDGIHLNAKGTKGIADEVAKKILGID